MAAITTRQTTSAVAGVTNNNNPLSNTQLDNNFINLNAELIQKYDSTTTRTANTFLAAPNGSAGAATFRTIVATDVPTLNQNTTGSAGSVASSITFNNGGSGDASGTAFNGSAVRTISHNTIGAASVSHNHTSLTGITSLAFAADTTDTGSITTTVNSGITYFDFNLSDDNNQDLWRWRFTPSGSTAYDAMKLEPTANGVARLTVTGSLLATTKSFLINHPTKPGKKLRYGSLEGPENGVYVRGKLVGNNTIQLPEYWTKLVDPSSITVNLTPTGRHQDLYVEEVVDNVVVVKNSNLINKEINCYYTVFGERVDVDKLEVEI